ncbi:unnamed protein product [Medioppia subpectinata]|uniref:Glutamate--cysteine ligase n=1 Tax=Medioppia subpectinata TaxID=1979941 RepID=A0A7R9KQP4_9ACAR|nr:unnamed protein product [Medioppia subpectinata]CAG2106922.1 unnamed protein product [Medioppia subpectinata]
MITMGLLPAGEQLNFQDSQRHAEHIRRQGIKQFINIYNRNKDRIDRCFKWGDEMEYTIVRFDHNSNKVRLSLRSEELLNIMYEREEREGENRRVLWRQESGSFQIEATPGQPYGYNSDLNDKNSMNNLFNNVENQMRERRLDIRGLLHEDEAILCLTNYPRMGCADTTVPNTKPDPLNSMSGSIFLSDDHISHLNQKYFIIEKYFNERIGHKVAINAPIFKDTKTPDPFIEFFDHKEAMRAAKVDHIYMDSKIFGNGCSCLQVTMQATDVNEAFILYDQLAPLTPIMMALGASTPIFRGYLSDRDGRWDVIVDSLDDRTPEERGEKPLKHNKYRIQRPRYSAIGAYLCESNQSYNDSPIVYNKDYYNELIGSGVPPPLAQHIAYLFIRDPILISSEKLDQNPETESDHFEAIQATNWQSLRFKPPPLNQPAIGWRVEFRPMEIQMTDAENAAFAVVTILLSRIILKYKLNFVIPITKIDENMSTAQKRDSVNRCKFWFRKDIFTRNTPLFVNGFNDNHVIYDVEEESYIEMSINEIMNGYEQEFPGLIPLMKDYVNSIALDAQTYGKVQQYVQLIADRASAKLPTPAQWIRDFVRKHNTYKYDSVVNEKITYDLLNTLNRIQNECLNVNELIKNN